MQPPKPASRRSAGTPRPQGLRPRGAFVGLLPLLLAACVGRPPSGDPEPPPPDAGASDAASPELDGARGSEATPEREHPGDATDRGAEPIAAAPEPEPAQLPPLPDTYLAFATACPEGPTETADDDAPPGEGGEGRGAGGVAGETVTIAAVGDVLLHHELQIQAFAADDRHRNLWRSIEDLLGAADITYANLEGPMAAGIDKHGEDVGDPGEVFDRVVYSAYPRFNFHPSVAVDLKRSGVDVVSTANNHALDRQAIGVDRTIDALKAAGLRHTGTRRSDGGEGPWHTVIRRRGLRVAFLACTGLLNVRPDSGGQVLRCRGKDFERRVASLAKKRGIDALIVTPHWGKEYSPEPREREVELAHRWAEAGATAIIGSHPHVLQPWERYRTEDGRAVLIHYSQALDDPPLPRPRSRRRRHHPGPRRPLRAAPCPPRGRRVLRRVDRPRRWARGRPRPDRRHVRRGEPPRARRSP